MYRPVPEDEPWVLDVIEAHNEPDDQWHRGVVVGIVVGVAPPEIAGADGLDPTEPDTAYQIAFDDGDQGIFTRSRLRVVEAGGARERAKAQIARGQVIDPLNPMEALRRRAADLH